MVASSVIAEAAACGKYAPEAFGARCDRCYLYKRRQGPPVPPELNPSSTTMVVAEAPGKTEVEKGRPLIGDSGQETMRALASLGVNRNDVSWSNAFLCRPPDNNLDLLLNQLKRENKERIAQGLEPYLTPMEACRPRFLTELRHQTNILAMGKISLSSITGANRSIMDMRGMPVEGTLDGDGKFHSVAYFANPGERVSKLRIMPTVHPAFVLRAPRWRKVFRVDMSRGVRWFRGALQWKEPTRIYVPDPATLEDYFFRQKHKFVGYDVETDAKEPLVAKLRCIGVGDPEIGIVVPFLSIDGSTLFYDSHTQAEINELFNRFFAAKDIIKTGHNAGYYDRIVIEQHFGVTPEPLVDSILYHRAVDSELPHNLGFVGSVFTDVMDAWKADHTATGAKSDEELWTYNLTDVVVQARTVEPMHMVVEQKKLLPAVALHHEVQKMCAGLHRTGMYVDQRRRKWHDERLKKEAWTHRQTMRQILDSAEFNPNSRAQVAEILFQKWGLTPEVIYASDPSAGKKLKKAYTTSGDPSTGDDVLRAMMLYVDKQPEKLAFVKSLRKFRGASKLRGTNIIPLRPHDEPFFESDDLQVNVDTEEGAMAVDEYDPSRFADALKEKSGHRKTKVKEKKAGLVLSDGRVHPHYGAHTTTSQRLSSSEPNGQNWSRKIRDIVSAYITESLLDSTKGLPYDDLHGNFIRALIAADMDQLELRFAAALAKAARYLEVFQKGGDPHLVTCEMLYGNAFKHASEGDQKRMRDFAKRFSYAVLYRATVETVHETLASSENDNGDLVFPWLTMRETRVFFDRWLNANPEIPQWWDRDLDEYRRQGYLLEPIFGWRRDFLDGEDPNEIANFKCQAGGSAIVHIATLKFLEAVPFERWGPGTGLIQQGHDAIMGEIPAAHAPFEVEKYKDGSGRFKVKSWCPPKCRCITAEIRQTLQECMTVDGRPFGLDVTFTASAKAGFRWTDV